MNHAKFMAKATVKSCRALVIANRTLAERERRIAALAAENQDLEAALNTSLEYWTVMKYNTEMGKKWTMAREFCLDHAKFLCQSVGRRLSAYCRTHGYEIKSCLTGDDRFSSVNSYQGILRNQAKFTC